MPGASRPIRFPSLPCSLQFKSLQWLGYVADGDKHAVFYLDNVKLKLKK